MASNKILYILPQPFLLPRGSSFRALATVKALVELGYEVDVLCYPLGEEPKIAGLTLHRSWRPPFLHSVKIGPSPAKILFDIPLACLAHRLVRTREYAVIHGVEEAGFIACWLGRKHRIPYIYDMHSWMSQQIEDGNYLPVPWLLSLFKRFESYAMKGAKGIITVGPEMTEIVKTRLAPEVLVATLPDCPIFFDDPAPPALAADIERRFFAGDHKVILYTGNFHPYQGIDLLLAGIGELRRIAKGMPFRLCLVGGGAGEAEALGRYKKMVSDLGINGEVVFCGEFPPEAMPVFIDKADVLVSSRVTGNNVPLKIYTYLASGKLLVATDIPSHTQVLNDTNSLLTAAEPVALAAGLYRALVDISPEDRQRLAAEARRVGGVEQFVKFRSILQDCYRHCISYPAVEAGLRPGTCHG